MGNRAVITTKDNYENSGVGIYLHWYGSLTSVKAFLDYCKLRGFRSPSKDIYGWAMLSSVICNYLGDGLGCGIGTVNHLDCHNGDNGVYFIGDDWSLLENSYGIDVEAFNPEKVIFQLYEIAKRQPEHMKLDDAQIISYAVDLLK